MNDLIYVVSTIEEKQFTKLPDFYTNIATVISKRDELRKLNRTIEERTRRAQRREEDERRMAELFREMQTQSVQEPGAYNVRPIPNNIDLRNEGIINRITQSNTSSQSNAVGQNNGRSSTHREENIQEAFLMPDDTNVAEIIGISDMKITDECKNCY